MPLGHRNLARALLVSTPGRSYLLDVAMNAYRVPVLIRGRSLIIHHSSVSSEPYEREDGSFSTPPYLSRTSVAKRIDAERDSYPAPLRNYLASKTDDWTEQIRKVAVSFTGFRGYDGLDALKKSLGDRRAMPATEALIRWVKRCKPRMWRNCSTVHLAKLAGVHETFLHRALKLERAKMRDADRQYFMLRAQEAWGIGGLCVRDGLPQERVPFNQLS